MNSNPFEPVSPEPATFEPTDSAPDDFMADSNNNNGAAKPARPAVMLDGVSPAPASTSFDPNTPPVDITTMGSALAPNEGPFEGSGAGDTTANTSDTSDSLLNDNDAPNDNFLNDASEPAKDTDTSTPILSGMLPDDKPVDDKADKKKAKKDKKGDKPARQFTISIASIILFLLAIGGIGGTIYYYLQNSSNSDKVKTYQARIAELENNGASTSDSENKTSSQFDALQDKITELTTQNADKQKTLDDNKTKIDDLTKKNADLTKTNEDLTKKVQNISDLTTRVDTLVNKLNGIYPN
jgi:cell division protein FtsB